MQPSRRMLLHDVAQALRGPPSRQPCGRPAGRWARGCARSPAWRGSARARSRRRHVQADLRPRDDGCLGAAGPADLARPRRADPEAATLSLVDGLALSFAAVACRAVRLAGGVIADLGGPAGRARRPLLGQALLQRRHQVDHLATRGRPARARPGPACPWPWPRSARAAPPRNGRRSGRVERPLLALDQLAGQGQLVLRRPARPRSRRSRARPS